MTDQGLIVQHAKLQVRRRNTGREKEFADTEAQSTQMKVRVPNITGVCAQDLTAEAGQCYATTSTRV